MSCVNALSYFFPFPSCPHVLSPTPPLHRTCTCAKWGGKRQKKSGAHMHYNVCCTSFVPIASLTLLCSTDLLLHTSEHTHTQKKKHSTFMAERDGEQTPRARLLTRSSVPRDGCILGTHQWPCSHDWSRSSPSYKIQRIIQQVLHVPRKSPRIACAGSRKLKPDLITTVLVSVTPVTA